VGSGAWSVRLWAPSGGAGAALGDAVRALSAAPLGVPGKALRLRRPGGYQARLRRPGNAVPSKITHPLNIIDFTCVSGRAPVLRAKLSCVISYLHRKVTATSTRTLPLSTYFVGILP